MAIEYLKNNNVRFTVYVGKDLKGKDIIARKTVKYINKRDARDQYKDFEEQVRSGQHNAGTSLGVIDLCNEYLSQMKRKGRKATTIRGYEFVINRVEDILGNPKAKAITPLMADRFVDELVEKGYSPKTVRNTVFFLASVYKQGQKWRLLTQNPFDLVELPPQEQPEKRVLLDSELDAFYSALCQCDDLDFTVAVGLALFCGLRRSEIMGLTESDVDFQNGIISINKSRHKVKLQDDDVAEDILQPTKTKRSTRDLSIPSILEDDLKRLIRMHKEKSLAVREYQKSEYLILNELGEPLTPNALTHRLRRFEEQNNLPPVTLHGLRHSHATFMNWQGYDVTEISRQLGHSLNTTTMNIYTHEFRQSTLASKSVANDFDNRLGRFHGSSHGSFDHEKQSIGV